MLLILFFSLFFLNLSLESVLASNFIYRFKLADNRINFNFTKDQSSANPDIESVVDQEKKEALTFSYQLVSDNSLITDIPIVLLLLGKEALFYVYANDSNSDPKQVLVDLRDLSEEVFQSLPVFYRNSSLGNFQFEVSDLKWLHDFPEDLNESSKLINLNAFREKNNSVTILFTVSADKTFFDSYSLICEDKLGEETSRNNLIPSDHFLWPGIVFSHHLPNSKNELIFQLKDFNCDGLVHVIGKSGSVSDKVNIIEITEI